MSDDASLTWIGNATSLLRLGRFTILTDPNFLHAGQRAYLGKGIWSRRLKDPAVDVDDLPPFSAVVLSHLHDDHFDRVARRGLDRTPPIITTRPGARKLSSWGFTTHGLDTWEEYTLTDGDEELRIESLPGTHGHGVMRALMPPVMGTLLEHRVGGQVRRRIMQSGDTLTGDHLDVIRQRHPDIDVALVHLGGTRVLMHTVTMDAVQGVDYLRRTAPKRAVPVHFDDYTVMKSPLSEFLAEVDRAGLRDLVTPVTRGQTVAL